MKFVHEYGSQGDTYYLISGVATIYTNLASREHLLENNGFMTSIPTKNDDERISLPSDYTQPVSRSQYLRRPFSYIISFFFSLRFTLSLFDCYPF